MEKLAEMALDIQQYKQSREPKNQLTEDMVQRYILPACYGKSLPVLPRGIRLNFTM
jgi:hypothetical protein